MKGHNPSVAPRQLSPAGSCLPLATTQIKLICQYQFIVQLARLAIFLRNAPRVRQPLSLLRSQLSRLRARSPRGLTVHRTVIQYPRFRFATLHRGAFECLPRRFFCAFCDEIFSRNWRSSHRRRSYLRRACGKTTVYAKISKQNF